MLAKLCDTHGIIFTDVLVQRDEKMTFQALRAKVEIPKLWVTGYYNLSDSKIMKLFKADSKGNFSINITGIEVEAIITLKTTLEDDQLEVMANNTLKLVGRPSNKIRSHTFSQSRDELGMSLFLATMCSIDLGKLNPLIVVRF
jgi:hypothetical protein